MYEADGHDHYMKILHHSNVSNVLWTADSSMKGKFAALTECQVESMILKNQ